MTQRRASLIDYWEAASVPELEAGLAWYKRAQREVFVAAEQCWRGWRESVPDSHLLAAAAILSPRKPWSFVLKGIRAMIGALAVGADPLSMTVPGFRACQIKAARALDGDLSGLSGQKVCAFYDNLLRPVYSKLVTVDCWALRAYKDDLHAFAKWLTPRQYDDVAGSYARAADEVGAIPCQFQAVVWLVARRAAKKGSSLYAINI